MCGHVTCVVMFECISWFVSRYMLPMMTEGAHSAEKRNVCHGVDSIDLIFLMKLHVEVVAVFALCKRFCWCEHLFWFGSQFYMYPNDD